MKNSDNSIIISPLEGEVIDLTLVKDEFFSSEAMEKGAAIIPSSGKLYAPCDGEVAVFLETGHAITIKDKYGKEVLIHTGLDTVTLNGKHFYHKKKQGHIVKKGDLLLEFDINRIKEKGLDITTPIIITNSDEFKSILPVNKDKEIRAG